ncbi:putative WRKY transcription factor 4 isoform X1 [Canna indica]|uniref:WRKY transcription factor 4 isoform X1 n=1 Tax=Canna indica TaxID=4628 RepID=A0AAQ3QC82_9LILI|nr:putative WRKY transcription factor 4 isoform X1 [Canna indica]
MPEEKASSERDNANGGASSEAASVAPPSSASSVVTDEPPPADRCVGPADKSSSDKVTLSPASTDGRSFSQLLAGAMASPAASPRSSSIVTVPVVSLPCFLTPAALVESQGLTGQFAMTHQAVLATVTAQAQMHLQVTCSSSSSNSMTNMLSTISPMPLQQMLPPTPKKIPGDIYNWRKYGQKQVKSSENARSYYRCTGSNCLAKKKVEHCPDGTVVEVIYRGKHNHDPPQKHRYIRDRGAQSCGPSLENENSEHPNTEPEKSDSSACKAEQNSSNETLKQQLFCSSDCEFDAATKSEEDVDDEPDPKRRLSENSRSSSTLVLKTIREYIVQTEIDARHLSDGYRWRKYGQKIVKGNSNPRSYYRCTHTGCPVRKHVERVSHDAKALLITYEGEHNHDQPTSKFASDSPLTALKVNVTSGVTDEQLRTSTSSVKESSNGTHKSTTAEEEVSAERKLELGGDRALESAQALLSIGFSSSSGENTARNGSDGMKSSILTETPAAVPVHNT